MAERVSFDRSLYLPEAVDAAAAAYRDHARIEVTRNEECTVAMISPVAEGDPIVLANAFCNHVLHETIARLQSSPVQDVA
jgi:hypothetical protein